MVLGDARARPRRASLLAAGCGIATHVRPTPRGARVHAGALHRAMLARMAIVGIEGMSDEQIRQEVARGGRFVVFQYTISLVVLTLRRSSAVHFIRAGEGAVGKGLVYSLITFLLGWWGIPWGPIYSIGSLVTNFGGGKDVTQQLLAGAAKAA